MTSDQLTEHITKEVMLYLIFNVEAPVHHHDIKQIIKSAIDSMHEYLGLTDDDDSKLRPPVPTR